LSDSRFVITRPHPSSGLGSNLLSLVGALYLAERTGRRLIVDWTGIESLRDRSVNYFVAFFEPIRTWHDVDVVYVNDDDPRRTMRYAADDVFRLTSDHMAEALDGKLDHPYLYLDDFHYFKVFRACVRSTPLERFRYTKEFYQALTPRPALRARLDAARATFAGDVVVALNVRMGNAHPTWRKGGHYANHVRQDVFERADFLARAYRACVDCVARLPREAWGPPRVLIVTDGAAMQRRLLTIPGAFAVRKRFPPSGMSLNFADFDPAEYGEYSDVESVNETIVDMFLMADCAGLVCNYTQYNYYAQYVTTFFNGNLRHFEHYFENPVRSVARRVLHWTQRRGLARSMAMKP